MITSRSGTNGCLSPAGPGPRVPCFCSSSFCSMDFISKSQLLSPAPFPNDDPASIKGNVSTEQKRLSGNVFAWHIANFPGSRVFGHSVFKDLKLTAIYIWTMNAGEIAELFEDTMSREAIRGQTICELTVTEGTLFLDPDGVDPKKLTIYFYLFDRDAERTSHVCWWLLRSLSRHVRSESQYSGRCLMMPGIVGRSHPFSRYQS